MAVRLAHPDSSARWSTAIGGFGFVVCFTVAAILYGSGAGRYSDQIIAYYSNQANRLAQIEGFVTLTIGLVLFAVFVAGLRAVATRSEPWSSLMFGTGLATVLCLVIAQASMRVERTSSWRSWRTSNTSLEQHGFALSNGRPLWRC